MHEMHVALRKRPPSCAYYYMCVLKLLYVSSYFICVCSNYCTCVRILSMCPHTTICVSSNYYVSAYYMCPHTTICVCSNYYICVLATSYYNTRWRWARVCSSLRPNTLVP